MKGARENGRRDGESLIIVALHNGPLDPLHEDFAAGVMIVGEIREEKLTSDVTSNGEKKRGMN